MKDLKVVEAQTGRGIACNVPTRAADTGQFSP
jgi:hypothetical protein